MDVVVTPGWPQVVLLYAKQRRYRLTWTSEGMLDQFPALEHEIIIDYLEEAKQANESKYQKQ